MVSLLNDHFFRRRDGIFRSGILSAYLGMACRTVDLKRRAVESRICRSFPSEKQSQGLERNLGRRSPCGEAEPLASNPEVGFDPSNTPHPGPVTREPLALISGLW